MVKSPTRTAGNIFFFFFFFLYCENVTIEKVHQKQLVLLPSHFALKKVDISNSTFLIPERSDILLK